MNLTPIGPDGLKRTEEQLEKTARDLARTALPANSEAMGAADEVSLSDSMVALLEARNSYEANLKLIAAEDELTRHVIDILG